jgi:hypothetical protein
MVALDLGPLAKTEHPHIVGLDAHAAELVKGTLALPDNSALEGDEHKKSEERVVPVFIEHPKTNTEDLEDEEGRDGVLLEQLGEGRDGNIKSVEAIVLLDARQLDLGLDTLGGLEVADGGLGLGVDVELERTKRLCLGVVEETALLEEE